MDYKKASALYVCSVLGAGFATGRELMVYFIKYGIWGILGILIASVIFSLIAYKAITSEYESLDKLCNSKLIFPLNKCVSAITLLFLIIIYSAMLSAGGELFNAIFNMPYIYGSFLMAAVSLFTIYGGGKAIGDISLILFPIIIITSVITGLYLISKGSFNIQMNTINAWFVPRAFIYSAYNIITASAVIIEYKNKNAALKTALISGVSIFMLAVILSLPILLSYEYVKNEPLPILSLIADRGIVFYIYVFMLVCAIFTTAATGGISAVRQSGLSPLVITIIAFIISFAGFSSIVDNIYFIFGVLGSIIIYCFLKDN